MAFLQVQFFSQALVVASTVHVILPEPSQGIDVDAMKVLGLSISNGVVALSGGLVIYTPRAIKPQIRPCAMPPGMFLSSFSTLRDEK